MSLRRLLALSAAVSGSLRRSFSTGVSSRPPWVLVAPGSVAAGSALRASVRIVEPPGFSSIDVPALHVNTSAGPDPDSDFTQLLVGRVCSASADGHLLITVFDVRATAPILAKQGANRVRQMITGIDPEHSPQTTRFLCNPLTGQLTRLPDIVTGQPRQGGHHMGVLTQADRGHGPPDRFAVAELQGNIMLRFLSDTPGDWEVAVTAPCKLPLARRVFFERGKHDQEAFAFGGRLWWVDLTWGAISADVFSEQPDPRFVELPRGSVLPARSTVPTGRMLRTIEEGDALRRCALGRYRRMGVSEGRLRYVEVWDREPFVLSLFSLDDEGSAWKLEHRVVLSRLWVDGDHPWLPLPEKTTPQIVALDPLNGDLIYLMVGRHVVVVDMNKEEVIGSSPRNGTSSCVTCVLPPWLESSRIPAAGKDDWENKTLADVLVRSGGSHTK